jgi:hypothetical protein
VILSLDRGRTRSWERIHRRTSKAVVKVWGIMCTYIFSS